MPNPASGQYKTTSYKFESAYGVAPGAAGAQTLRRVTSAIALSKDVYQSNEIRTDFQVSDERHGVRRVKGPIAGELSAKTYADFFAMALKRDFTAGASAAGLSVTVAGAGPYTITRAAGSFLTDGFKIGDVMRLSVGSLNTANISKNLMITALVALVATVIVLNGSALVPEGPIVTTTATVFGKKTFIPTTGHTDKSMALEDWYSDVAQSELFLGQKASKIDINLPATGMATISIDMVGKDAVSGVSQYYTAPSVIGSNGTMAAVNGIIRVAGVTVFVITGATLSIAPTYTGDPVVGSNVVPFQFAGPVSVSGQFTGQFIDGSLRDIFWNETEFDIYLAFTADNSAAADFVSFSMPRNKLTGATKDDGAKSIVQTLPFMALLNNAGGTGLATEKTAISIQDSAA